MYIAPPPQAVRTNSSFFLTLLQTNQIKGSLVVTESRGIARETGRRDRRTHRVDDKNKRRIPIWRLSGSAQTTWKALLNYVHRIGSIDCHHRTQKSFLSSFSLPPWFLSCVDFYIHRISRFLSISFSLFFWLLFWVKKEEKNGSVLFSFLGRRGEVDGISHLVFFFFYDSHSIHFISTMFVSTCVCLPAHERKKKQPADPPLPKRKEKTKKHVHHFSLAVKKKKKKKRGSSCNGTVAQFEAKP